MSMNYVYFILIGLPLILSYPLIDRQLKHKHSKFYLILIISTLLYVISYILGYFELDFLYAFFILAYPLFFYAYYRFFCRYDHFFAILYSLFIYLAFETTDTFLSVILSSITGDYIVTYYSIFFVTLISVLSIVIITRIIAILEVNLLYFKERVFKKFVQQLIVSYLILTLVLNASQMKTVRDRYEKKMELKQKRFEQRQMEQYMNKIQGLYLELKGFRHDFGNIITSLNLAIEEENIEDIKRIQRDVLEEWYGQLQKEEYTGFDLGNIRDSALRSILSRGWIYAEEMGVKLTFETEDIIEKVPMRLLDLVRTVGILVNNAIEAAKMSQEKEVQIAIFNMPNGVHLIIKNSISDEPINWNKLYEKGFSTKGDRRGMGLAIVKELIGEYAAIFLETELINGRFTQSLVIGEKGR